jgi:hypothetical protein
MSLRRIEVHNLESTTKEDRGMDSAIQDSISARRTEAVDSEPASRPGVPMLPENPAPYPTVAGRPLEQQIATEEILVGVEARINAGGDLTPVFGTSVPPRGLSGVIRRAAYEIPEHKGGRWVLLMLGDRVDVWEGRIARHPIAAAAIVLGVISAFAFTRRWRA